MLLVVMLAGSIALFGQLGGQKDAESELVSSPAVTELFEDAGISGRDETAPTGLGAGEAADAVAAPGPDYVSLDGAVWLLASAASPAPTAPATAGVVTSSLAEGYVSDHNAYYAGFDRSVLYVQLAGEGYASFRRVIRTVGRAEYALVTGTPLRSYGQWPTLPARFAPPENADGSPTFYRWGFDDRTVYVYIPSGSSVDAGFAVPPNTPSPDPSAGNPGWTWWEPLD
ncbi:MAG: hypothetical protein EG823_07690 [Actinobacteria bacterium]|nr:hypothetical protein [Actinomycetota bacterium]